MFLAKENGFGLILRDCLVLCVWRLPIFGAFAALFGYASELMLWVLFENMFLFIWYLLLELLSNHYGPEFWFAL